MHEDNHSLQIAVTRRYVLIDQLSFEFTAIMSMPFVSLEDLDQTEEMPGYFGSFLHSNNMTVANWSVEAGADFPEHSHPHEQVSIVLEGEFELTIEGETKQLRPGRIAIIPSDAVHSGRAVTDCEILDIFSPVREEYRHER